MPSLSVNGIDETNIFHYMLNTIKKQKRNEKQY